MVAVIGSTALGASTIGLWLALRAPSREELLSLAVGLIGISFGTNLLFLFQFPVEPKILEVGFLTAAFAGMLFGTVGLLRFFALFPRRFDAEGARDLFADQLRISKSPKRTEKLEREIQKTVRWVLWVQGSMVWRRAGQATLVIFACSILIAVFDTPAVMQDTFFFVVAVAPPLFALAWGATGAAALSSLVFVNSTGEDRRRLLWIRWGMTTAIVVHLLFGALMALGIVVGFESTTLVAVLAIALPLPPLCFLAGLAIAVFYDGALDPSLAIRRTTVYGALGILFVFLFAGFGNVASEFVEQRLGLPGIVGTALYGGTVAVLLLPLRGWFTRATGRWVPKLEGDEEAKSF